MPWQHRVLGGLAGPRRGPPLARIPRPPQPKPQRRRPPLCVCTHARRAPRATEGVPQRRHPPRTVAPRSLVLRQCWIALCFSLHPARAPALRARRTSHRVATHRRGRRCGLQRPPLRCAARLARPRRTQAPMRALRVRIPRTRARPRRGRSRAPRRARPCRRRTPLRHVRRAQWSLRTPGRARQGAALAAVFRRRAQRRRLRAAGAAMTPEPALERWYQR
mmetsp:Transcript_8397/g.34088  ORF Transcript_8397/g.34088 Transcript_8397/m.34088 type:complete len:220 (+) Transcript_8397:1082-1741(+)